MKKFVAVLLSALTIAAVLFSLTGCVNSLVESKTRKQWIKYEFTKNIYNEIEASYMQDRYIDDKNSEVDFKIKKLTKYVSVLPKNVESVYTENKIKFVLKCYAYKVEAIRYSTFGNIEEYNFIAYIYVINCPHYNKIKDDSANTYADKNDSYKYCVHCVKYMKFVDTCTNKETIIKDKLIYIENNHK